MSSRFIRYTFLFILFVLPGFSGSTLFASGFPATDSSHVVVRQPDSKFIEAYRSQKEFIYTLPPLETSFFKQLWAYLMKKFGSWEELTAAIPFIYKILMGGLILFSLFIVVTKIRLYQLFYSDKEIETPNFEFSNTDDQFIDFDEAIHQQMEQHQYRQAIRLYYLKMINILRIKEIIRFSKEKTNIDYLGDLTNKDLKLRFTAITSIYNHVWYGDIEITEDQFLRFEERFQSFYSAIDVKE